MASGNNSGRQSKAPTRFTVRSTTDAGPRAILKERLIEEIYARTLPLFQSAFVAPPFAEEDEPLVQSPPKAKEENSSDVMNVMTTSATSLEEQVAKMSKILETLSESIKQKDDQIAFLMKKVDNLTEKKTNDYTPTPEDEEKKDSSDDEKKDSSSSDDGPKIQITKGSIPADQLRDLIKEAVKDQVESISQPSYSYVKPYSKKIDLMKMPANYQPPKFQ